MGWTKIGQQTKGKSRANHTTKIHAVVAGETLLIVRHLSSGAAGDFLEGQALMEQIPKVFCCKKPLLIDKAYEGERVPSKGVEMRNEAGCSSEKESYQTVALLEAFVSTPQYCRALFP